MTRSSRPVHEHILDFDDDFEITLRRRRKQQHKEDPTAQVGGEEQGIAMDNLRSRSLPPRVWIMPHHCVSNIPWLLKVKPKSLS
ncbi:hypothetical protein ACFX2I_017482 [Malus domestica]